MTPTKRIAIVVVNYNSSELLRENLAGSGLDSIATIVVIDNSTAEDERSSMARLAAEQGWILRSDGTNAGFGAAMNSGAAVALVDGADTLVLLNPDASISPEHVIALAARANERRIVAPRIVNERGETWFSGGRLDASRGVVRHAEGSNDWLTGACLAIDRTAWKSLGGFDDRYFLYWEDVDLSARWREGGGELEILDHVTAVHAVGGTQGTVAAGKSLTYVFYNSRNRLVFSLREGGPGRWASVGLWTPIYSYRLFRRARPVNVRQGGRVVGAVLKGIVAGVKISLSSRHGWSSNDG